MKVSELIVELSKFDGDADIVINDSEYSYSELEYVWKDAQKIVLSETPQN